MRDLQRVEAERDIWRGRFHRLMSWVQWFKEIANWRPKNYRNKNRMIGLDDLFVAVLELEKEVEAERRGCLEATAYLCSLAAGRDEYIQTNLTREHERNLAATESTSGGGENPSGRIKGAEK